MSFLRWCLTLGLAGWGYGLWLERDAGSAHVDHLRGAGGGFVQMPRIEGSSARRVLVVAARNCPRAEARRADRLAAALADLGIPVARGHQVRFTLDGPVDGDTVNRVSGVMNGPLPIVFVNGRAKANPSLDEVVAEFGTDRR